jgi:L-aspartate oxidase
MGHIVVDDESTGLVTKGTGWAVMKTLDCDYFIIGSGMAGLSAALELAKSTSTSSGQAGRVLIVTKKAQAESNTNYAQGGIACVMRHDGGGQHRAACTGYAFGRSGIV